jgi:cell division protein FtsB
MKILLGLLGMLIVAIQMPLWVGKGGWLRAWEVDRQLEAQRGRNLQLEARNAALGAEVTDLKQGLEAVEERARHELGMVKGDELFYQFAEPARANPDAR